MHYNVAVMIKLSTLPENYGREQVEEALAEVMAPFCQELQKDQVLTSYPCDCAAWRLYKAYKDRQGAEAAQDKYHHAIRPLYDKLRHGDEATPENEAIAKQIKELEDGRILDKRAFAAANPEFTKPKPDCEKCHGTGTVQNTDGDSWNPRGKWDWYQIGGRWTGELTGEAPEKNPENWEDCRFHQGDSCIHCNGTKRVLKWPTAFAPQREWRPVADLKEPFPAYAYLTKDGQWVDSEDFLGAGGSTHDEWQAKTKALYESHQDCLVVNVDCHS